MQKFIPALIGLLFSFNIMADTQLNNYAEKYSCVIGEGIDRALDAELTILDDKVVIDMQGEGYVGSIETKNDNDVLIFPAVDFNEEITSVRKEENIVKSFKTKLLKCTIKKEDA